MGVKIVRRSKLGNMIDALRRTHMSSVEVGISPQISAVAHYPDGTPVAYVAAIQEFGAPAKNIPARSFMRSTLVERDADIKRTIQQGGEKLIAGEITSEFFLDVLGSSMMGAIQQKIKSITSPPLAPATIAARQRKKQGSSNTGNKPLVFTGVLISSIGYKVNL